MTDQPTGEASTSTLDAAAIEAPETLDPNESEAPATVETEPAEPAAETASAETASAETASAEKPSAADDGAQADASSEAEAKATEAKPAEAPLAEAAAETEGGTAEAQAQEEEAGEDAEAAERVEAPAAAKAEAAEAAEEAEEGEGPVLEPESASFFKEARENRKTLAGKVIGWNKGGFHVVIEGHPAFCPRSEIELGEAGDAESYVDRDFAFQVLRVESKGRRVVVSRSAALRSSRTQQARDTMSKLEVGAVVRGRVASLVEFGAFVDLGGIKGLVHISEISHRQVRMAEDVLSLGQEVEVEILKIQNKGKRISLSMKALEPDPWEGVAERYKEGQRIEGVIERTNRYGAFISIEPGLTGLLPMSEMNLPRGSQAERVFPPGKKIEVQVLSVRPGQKRISLGLEGSRVEGSSADFKEFKNRQEESASGFNSLAAAFEKLK